MNLNFSPEEEAFREQVVGWLEENLTGSFARLRYRGGPGDENAFFEERRAWERHLGASGWIGLGWPKDCGGQDLPLAQQMIFYEEYARAGGPGRVGHVGEMLLGPTVAAFGTKEQKETFLPPILAGDVVWCQGYSEPGAGSDLANIQTRARLQDTSRGKCWVLEGQKIWTSLAQWAQWCFVLCRTQEDSQRHRGLSCLLVSMEQEGVEVRPIRQMTGDSEFSEVFFDGAQTPESHVVGAPGEGWRVAMGTLAFERGVSTLGQQMNFRNELKRIIESARNNGAARDPLIRQRLAQAALELDIMRAHALRVMSDTSAPLGAYVSKLYWASWHRQLGKLAMDVLGPQAEALEGTPYELTPLQRLFLFSRADTIYAGTNQIQRNIIAQRALGLPKGGSP